MLTELRNVVNRAQPTLMHDAAGVAALAVLLVVGLHLPLFV